MKTISIIKDKKSSKGHAFMLSNNVTAKEFQDFKDSYYEYMIKDIQLVMNMNSKITYDLENPPEIWQLRNFMKEAHTMIQWNNRRERAKELFSKETISELDASGFINTIIK